MSLLGLLSMGRSFGTVRRRPPSYQVAEGWLPDFSRRQEREMGDVGGRIKLPSQKSLDTPKTRQHRWNGE